MKIILFIIATSAILIPAAQAEFTQNNGNPSVDSSTGITIAPTVLPLFTTACESGETDCSKDRRLKTEAIIQAAIAGEITVEEAAKLLRQINHEIKSIDAKKSKKLVSILSLVDASICKSGLCKVTNYQIMCQSTYGYKSCGVSVAQEDGIIAILSVSDREGKNLFKVVSSIRPKICDSDYPFCAVGLADLNCVASSGRATCSYTDKNN